VTDALDLGARLEMSRVFKADHRAAPAAGGRRHVPAWKAFAASGQQRLQEEFELHATEERVRIVGEGLGQLYVVFGAPGVGKSYFFMKVLNQLAREDWDERWGGILLDPKGTLAARATGLKSASPLLIGSSAAQPINLLASHLPPVDLGVVLALAAQSTGVGGSEPYWINQLKLLFGQGLLALSLLEQPLTLRSLAELFLLTVQGKKGRVDQLALMLDELETKQLGPNDVRRRDRALSALRPFAGGKGENVETTRSFIQQVLSPFLEPDLDHLSDGASKSSISDLVFREGAWVVLDLPRTAISTSKFIATLVKIQFQQAALARPQLYPDVKRRVFMIIDEYAELATDLPGDGFGDSYFFSQMREFKVFALVATQGVPMLENSAVRETWKTIITNSAGKIVMRVGDEETAELAVKLRGEADAMTIQKGASYSGDSNSLSATEQVERQTELASAFFLRGLARGQFAFIGTLDGKGRAVQQFVEVGD
jgi:hypothetical protein